MCIHTIMNLNTYIGIHVCIMNVCIDYDTLYVIACRSVYAYTQICGKICIERIVAEVFNDSNIVLTWHVPRRNEGYICIYTAYIHMYLYLGMYIYMYICIYHTCAHIQLYI